MENVSACLVCCAVVLGGCGGGGQSSPSADGGGASPLSIGPATSPSQGAGGVTEGGVAFDAGTAPVGGATPDAGSMSDAGSPAVDGCVTPAGLTLKDQDFSDSQLPWRRIGGAKVVIYFETKNVSQEFIGYMQKGVTNWNKSPCLDTRLIDTCQPGTNCVTVRAPDPASEDDGNFDAKESEGFTTGGHIDVATGLSVGERLNVTIHEMGHAVGLRHRLAVGVLMNGDTYDDVFVSDSVDYQNLLVLYGKQK